MSYFMYDSHFNKRVVMSLTKEFGGLDKKILLGIYQSMAKSRVLEERLIKIYRAGESFFWIGGPGDATKLTGNAGLAASSTSATAAISAMAAAATAAATALGGTGGGGGGLFDKLFSGIGSLFSGGDGIGGGGEGSLIGGFFADGGNVRPNTINRVNERGPELLNVSGNQYLMMGSRGGSVTSHENAFGGGMTVHNTFTIGGNVDRRTQNQIAESAGRGVRMAQSRNG